jgi:hypothetical protein
MSSLLRSAAVSALVSLLAASMPGCSQQGEGERCDLAKNGNADCDSGLSCVPAQQLRIHATDRCCKPGGASTDSRCDEGSPTPNNPSEGGASEGGAAAVPGNEAGMSSDTGGTGGTGDTGGTGGTGGSSSETAGGPSEGGMTATDAAAGKGGA